MQYYSTKHQSDKVSFKEAMIRSEATDGGLYMPERLPQLPRAFINNIAWTTLKDLAYVINNIFFGEDVPSHILKRIGDAAASYSMPLYEIEEGIYVMELFHGPTKTVKDFGAQTLTQLIRETTRDETTPLNVFVSTTGHSGTAIAHCFKESDGVNVFVLYPKGKSMDHIEPLHSLGEHIHIIEVNGTIDDCNDLITKALNDHELNSGMMFTSANSMNIGSLLPSTIPFFHAYGQLISKDDKASDIYISVPSGNCGNLLAGYIAKKMGLPITRLIGACNANAGFYRYMATGENNRKARHLRTYAFGMDMAFNANKPRFEELCGHDRNALAQDIVSEVCSDQAIATAINDVYNRTGYLLDPHSAVAYVALKRKLPKGASGIVMATAHPSLSSEVLAKVNDGSLRLPYRLNRQKSYCVRPELKIQPAYGALKKYLKYYEQKIMDRQHFA